MKVIVHVDRLVLSGFEPGEKDTVAKALRVELARRLSEPAAVHRLLGRGDSARLKGGTVRTAGADLPKGVSTRVAQRVVGEVTE